MFYVFVSQFSGTYDAQTTVVSNDIISAYGTTLNTGSYEVQGSRTSTYYKGDISTGYQDYAQCISDTLVVTIPAGKTITSVDVEYEMTAKNGAYMSEQYSRIACINPGGKAEATFTQGVGSSTGTMPYSRSGLDIANNVTGGGDIAFVMHAYKVWPSNSDCDDTYSTVDNGTWNITVHYGEEIPYPIAFNQAGNRSITSGIFDFDGDTEGDVVLNIDFSTMNATSTYPVVVEYSTNGSTWTLLEDDAAVDSVFAGSGYSENYTLPQAALTATTQIRIKQLNSVSLNTNQNNFTINDMLFTNGIPFNSNPVATDNLGGMFDMLYEATPAPADVEPNIAFLNVFEQNTTNNAAPYYPGEDVTVEANFAANGATLSDFGYAVMIGDLLIPTTPQFDQGNMTIDFNLTIPVDIQDAYNTNGITVYVLSQGTEVIAPTGGINTDIVTDATFYNEANLLGAPDYSGGSEILFTGSGERSYITEPINIVSAENARLSIQVMRLSEAIPAAGTELVLEYWEGTKWIEIDEIPLTGAGGANADGYTSFIYYANDLMSIASSETQFRIRQKTTNNLEDINSWAIQDFKLKVDGVGGNELDQASSAAISSPTFTVRLNTTDNNPIYPGEPVEFIIENREGEIPSYAYYEVSYGDRFLQTLPNIDNNSTFSINVPFDQGYKTLTVHAQIGNASLNASTPFTIQNVPLTIDSYTTDGVDGSTEYNVAGKTIDVAYSMNGMIYSNVAKIYLQVETISGWVSIDSTEVTTAINTAQGGTLSGTLPAYNLAAAADLRVLLMNATCNDALGCYGKFSDANFTFDNDVQYLSNSINMTNIAKGAFDIFSTGDLDITSPVELVYKAPAASDWTVYGTIDLSTYASNYVGFINTTVDFAEYTNVETIIGTQLLGIRHPNVETGTLYAVNGSALMQRPAYEMGEDAVTLTIEYPSISLSDFNDVYNRDIRYGETIEMQYNTFEIPSNIAKYAITLEQMVGGKLLYYVIGESTNTGLVNLNVTFPTKSVLDNLGFNTANSYQVRVRAYDINDDMPVISALNDNFDLTDGEFFAEISGYDFLNDEFNNKEKRFALTKSFDLASYKEPVVLSFDYEASIDNVNAYTLPHIQVSINNGVNYFDLTAENSAYTDLDRLDANGSYSYSIEIPAEYITSATHFRWIQDAVSNVNEDEWNIYNINVTGKSNLIEDTQFDVKYLTGNGALEYYNLDLINAVSHLTNLDAYRMTFPDFDYQNNNGFDPVIMVGEETKLAWTVPLDENNEPLYVGPIWPDSTEFEFIIVYNNNNDTIFINQVGENNALLFTIPASLDIETDAYTWEVRAKLEYFDENGEVATHYAPVQTMADFTTFKDLESGNNFRTLIINETTPDALLLVAEDLDNLGVPTYYINEELTMQYAQYGNWGTDVDLALVLEQRDFSGNVLDRTPLELVTNADNDSITATLPSAIVEDADLDHYTVGLYPYMGTNIEFGEDFTLDFANDFETLVGYDDGDEGFILEGDRYAITNSFDFSAYDSVLFTFNLDINVPENPATMVKLEVSTDGGTTYSPLTINNEAANFGADGFLPADYDDQISLIIPKAYCTATTSFRFSQESNLGDDEDVWYIWDLTFTAGSNILVNYTEENTIQQINFKTPAVNNYVFELEKDANGYEPVLYSGSTANFTFIIDSVMGEAKAKFPAGTIFDFYIEDYPLHGDTTRIASGTGINYTFTVPADIPRDTYTINVKASFQGTEYDYDNVYTLPIYNPVLTTKIDNNNEVIFAGNTVNFTGEWESDAVVPNTNWYYNLLMMATDFNGNPAAWLLASQQSATNFTSIKVPAYVRNANFIIVPTIDEAIGVEGEELNMNADLFGSQDLDTDNFIDEDYQNDGSGNWAYRLANSVGAEEMLTTEPLDLTGVDFVQFDILAVDYNAEDYIITDNQKVILEYSIDGGNNYKPIDMYPNTNEWNAAGLDTDNDYFLVKEMLPAEAQVKDAILRWRIEEYKQQFYIDNVLLRANFKLAPVVPNGVSEVIAQQRIEVDSVAYTKGSKGGQIELFYDIKGKFGADNILNVAFNNDETGDNGLLELDLSVNKPLTFTGITEGKGSVTFDIGSIADFTLLHGEGATFRLIAEDNTLSSLDKYQDMNVAINIYGDWSEYAADIDVFQAPDQPTIEGTNDLAVCEGGSVVLNAPAGFTYYKWNTPSGTFDGNSQTFTADKSGSYTVQVANENFDARCFSAPSEAATLEVIEINDIDFSNQEIEVCQGATSVEITIENTQPFVQYTLKDGLDAVYGAATGNGFNLTFYVSNLSLVDGKQVFYVEAASERLTTCSKVVTQQLLTVFETPELGVKAYSADDGNYEVTEENDVFCENVDLGIGKLDGPGTTTAYQVTWYKDGIKYSTGNYIINAEPGTYYAEYKHGNSCIYTTNSIIVDATPARQVITAAGDLEFCEGEGELLLSVPTGFAQYIWKRNGSIIETSGNDNELHVGQTGGYTVEVASEYGCASVTSKTTEVKVFSKPIIPTAVQFGAVICENGIAQVRVDNTYPDVLYTLVNAETGELMSTPVLGSQDNTDGRDIIIESTASIDTSVTAYILAERADISACNQQSQTFEINVARLSVNVIGNTLIAKVTGAYANSYQWFRNNKAILNGGSGNTLTVFDDANYSLLVSTSNGCELTFTLGQDAPSQASQGVTLKSYPNPVKTEMSLELNNVTGKVRIEIVDIMGQVKKVFEFTAEHETEIQTINLDAFEPGLYTIRVSGDNIKQMKNFIKN